MNSVRNAWVKIQRWTELYIAICYNVINVINIKYLFNNFLNGY